MTTFKPRILFQGCPLCQSDAARFIRRGNSSAHPLYNPLVDPVMNWKECGNCSHVFTDGYYAPEVYAALFNTVLDKRKPGADFESQRYVSARMVEKVARYASLGRWLDVGFGNGSLLFTAQEWGFDPVGIDLRSGHVEELKRLGVEAHCIDLADLREPDGFAVISMADVLEHMPFPRKALGDAYRLLRPHGVLFTSMPHFNCAAWKLLDANNANPYWNEIEHLHNFSRQRLCQLAEEEGFSFLHYGVSERYRVCMEVIFRRD